MSAEAACMDISSAEDLSSMDISAEDLSSMDISAAWR
jgi:hypothetical protein